MAFEKVETQVDFPALERSTLQFWQQADVFERLRQKNQAGPRWSFLDGPITANNPMGVHHAWGRTYKDLYQRYHAMNGCALRYQNGFDCQGLWVEVEVEKELKLSSKRDIENLVSGDKFASIDRFVTLCKERVDRFARRQTEQSIRLGYWMDWDRDEDWARRSDDRRSYFTMSERNNYTIWSFLKKCHDRRLVYKSYDAMPWCGRCGTGISQQEMNEGYQLVAHRSVFVKFPLRDKPGEHLLIWTTTPWTLSSNVGAAVNPTLTYLRLKHKDEFYYVAKGALTAARLEEQFKRKEWVEGVPKLRTVEQLFKEKGGYELAGEIAGKDMVGWRYEGPFDHIEAQNTPKGYPADVAANAYTAQWTNDASASQAHRVVAWDIVGETEGTGIVHIAPGCGKEDYQLGKVQGLPPVAPLDDSGTFLSGFGELSGKSALDPTTTDWILDYLQKKGRLLTVEKYPHSYPHCWRCKTELLFRLVDEWFIEMSWRDEIKQVVQDVTFLPESINGKARELDWLNNMGDWMISKKRFWGLALPIWVCESEACGAFDVIGSRAELKSRAVEGWEQFEGHSPHRPWIDLVKLKCTKCGGTSSRIGDVGNPWLDAGIVPYSTVKYDTDPAYWEQWFPADMITECFPGQFRNWFYAILAMSTMMTGRAPFKTLLGHALVRDEHGDEMHKSKGNAIPFEGAADDGYTIRGPQGDGNYPPMGADCMRWLYCRQNPAQNINFGPRPADDVRSRFILKLWNTYAFFCNYARLDSFDPQGTQVSVADRPDIDRWILSDLQLLVEHARASYERYDITGFCTEVERFVDEKLSNWYVRRNRRRFWKSDQGSDKLAAYHTLHTVLVTLTKLIAPVMPFLADVMYRNMVDGPADRSVHLEPYPQANPSLVDPALSADMESLLRLVSLGMAARNAVKIKVRQPLAELKILAGSEQDSRAAERFADQIVEELNIKRVSLQPASAGSLLNFEIKPNLKTLGPKFGSRMKDIQAALAKADPLAMGPTLQGGGTIELPLADGPVTLDATDVLVTLRAAEGWSGMADHGTQLALDTRITSALAQEGMARDVVRQVQDLRKTADLQIEDRIELHLAAEGDSLAEAIVAHGKYIGEETLAQLKSAALSGADVHTHQVKIDGQGLVIQLRRVSK